MSSFYLHPKYIHIQHSQIFYCPKPQDNERCQGKFIKTRVGQKECVECMRQNNTIFKHPIYKHIFKFKKICYTYKRTISP